jgi:translocation and assembly module TamB
LKGLIKVDSLEISGLDLERRPEIKSSEKSSSGGTLPFDIIAHFKLSGTMTHQFLAPETRSRESGRLGLDGDFTLIDGAVTTLIQSSWLDDQERGVELQAELSQGREGGPDQLNLNLTAKDGHDGPLSYLLNRPDWPDWSLTVNGHGPLNGWQGVVILGLLAEDQGNPEEPGTPNEVPLFGQARGNLPPVATVNLTLAGKTGTIREDLIKNRNMFLTIDASAKTESLPLVTGNILKTLGDTVTLTARILLQGQSVEGGLSVQTTAASVDLEEFGLELGDQGFDLTGRGQIDFDSDLTTLLKNKPDPGLGLDWLPKGTDNTSAPDNAPEKAISEQTAPLQPVGGTGYPAIPPQPVFSSAPDSSTNSDNASNANNSNGADKPGNTNNPNGADNPGNSGNLSKPDIPDLADPVTTGDKPTPVRLKVAYELAFSSKEGQLELSRLDLAGSGLNLKASGRMNPDSSREADLRLDLNEDCAFWPLIQDLVGQTDRESGHLNLAAHLAQDQAGFLDLTANVNLGELAHLAKPWGGQVEAKLSAHGPIDTIKVDLTLKSPNLKGPREDFPETEANYLGEVLGLPSFKGARGNITIQTGPSASGPIDLAVGFDLSLPQAKSEAASQTAKPGSLSASLEPDRETSTSESDGPAMDLALTNLNLSAGQEKELLDLESPRLRVSLRPGSVPTLGGSLKLKVGDWKTVQALTGLDLKGSPASLEANLDPTPGSKNSAQVKLDLPELRLGGELKIQNLKLDLTVNNYLTNPDFDLALTVGQSQLGPIGLSKGQVKGQGDGKKANLTVDLSGANGSELLNLTGSGDLMEKKATITSLRLASIPQLPGGLKLNQPMTLDFSFGLSLAQASISLGQGGTLDISGSLDPLDIKAKLIGFSYDNLSGLTKDAPQGKADLTVAYTKGGSGSFDLTTQITAPAALEGLSKTLNITANGKIEGSRFLSGKIALTQTRLKDISLDYHLPLIPTGQFFKPDLDGPLTANLVWKGPVAPLWNLIGLADRSLTGELDFDLKLEGSARKPKPKVKMYVANAQYQDLVLGILLSRINMEVHDQADGDLWLVLEARDQAEGRLALEGSIKPFASPPSLSVRGQLRRLSPLHRDDSTVVITGLAALEGPFTALTISTKVVVEEAEIDLDMAKGGSSITTLDLDKKLTRVSYGPKLSLDVDLPRQIFIRGKGLDSEWGGHLDITNPFGHIQINGTLKPIRGTFDLLSKQFTFTGGDIKFMNSPRLNPALNVELTRQTSSLIAQVKVTGFVARPILTLSSQPPYPSDEVLSQVLFGKKVSQLSRVEALQLANSLRVMAGLGDDIGLAVLGTMRDALGLSVLRFSDTSTSNPNRILGGNSFRENLNLGGDNDTDDTTTLEAGRYIGDNIYVGLEQNLTDNTTGVRVEVELSPNITLQSLTSSTSNRVGLGWKRDY